MGTEPFLKTGLVELACKRKFENRAMKLCTCTTSIQMNHAAICQADHIAISFSIH